MTEKQPSIPEPITAASRAEERKVQVHVTIDDREHGLIKLLEKHHGLAFSRIFTVKRLDLGDIVLTLDNDVFVVIERKTISDLIASILDKRFREQRTRLLATYPASQIMYLLEGDMEASTNQMRLTGGPRSFATTQLHSAIANLQFRDKVVVHSTGSLKMTSEYLSTLVNKLQTKGPFAPLTAAQQEDLRAAYCGVKGISTKKSNNLTKEDVFLDQLTRVPKISRPVAKAIEATYSCWADLMRLSELPAESIQAKLMDLPCVEEAVGVASSKRRRKRVGPAAANSIVEFVFGKEIKKPCC